MTHRALTHRILAAALLVATATFAMATERDPAYRYSGPHAGGPAAALIPSGVPQPVERPWTAPAYRYSGPHAGGPANDLPRN